MNGIENKITRTLRKPFCSVRLLHPKRKSWSGGRVPFRISWIGTALI